MGNLQKNRLYPLILESLSPRPRILHQSRKVRKEAVNRTLQLLGVSSRLEVAREREVISSKVARKVSSKVARKVSSKVARKVSSKAARKGSFRVNSLLNRRILISMIVD